MSFKDPPPLPLLSFPNELLIMIASNLPVNDLASLVLTGRYLHLLLNSELYNTGAKLRDFNNESPLHWAAECGQLNTARHLLSRGADPSLQTIFEQQTPLHVAASFGHLELAKLLFDDSSMTIYDCHGRTALHMASLSGQDEIVKFILAKHPGAVSAPCLTSGKTLLHNAAEEGHISTVTLLISLGADPNALDASGFTPLHMAATEGHYKVCKRLIDSGAKVSVADGDTGTTPLHNASQSGNSGIVELLVESGAVITRNVVGQTPIHSALYFIWEDVIRFFLEHDASGEAIKMMCGSGQPLLIYAFCGHKPPPLSLLQLLLDHKADVNCKSEVTGQTALFCAASADNVSVLKLFLKYGGDVTVQDQSGATALHEAASVGQVPAVKLLVEVGAEIDACDQEGQTPLYYAVERGREDMVRVLVNLGANINVTDSFGMSPLSRACAQCYVHVNVEMVRLLIEKGAYIRSKDSEGMTALHHASREGHAEVVALLLKGGARAQDRDRSGENALDLAEAYSRTNVVDLLRQNMGMIKA